MPMLIVYGTTDGHTAALAHDAAQALRGEGHDVMTAPAAAAPPPAGFEAVIVAASLHAGHYQAAVIDYVRTPSHGARRAAGGVRLGLPLRRGARPRRLGRPQGLRRALRSPDGVDPRRRASCRRRLRLHPLRLRDAPADEGLRASAGWSSTRAAITTSPITRRCAASSSASRAGGCGPPPEGWPPPLLRCNDASGG
ncbi:MAG: hypothetical protein JO013_12170 [Alphaproteobacteria bacterium]|nr:hypothetical protein [Alphaproteobacteria bacterium]